jgi:hypothetical protein
MRWWVFLACLLAISRPARAIERDWIIHEAELIVVGTLHPNTVLPWIDGWHMSGSVEVEEVLFGPSLRGPIPYRFDCTTNWLKGGNCTRWPPPRFPDGMLAKALWFFKRSGDAWQPSAGIGASDLSRRREVEDYIRKYKRASAK